jgi:hypothetical protein
MCQLLYHEMFLKKKKIDEGSVYKDMNQIKFSRKFQYEVPTQRMRFQVLTAVYFFRNVNTHLPVLISVRNFTVIILSDMKQADRQKILPIILCVFSGHFV